ncbi:hypothetical protein CDAR_203551 [Caerostris darwini]|uniref:Uncharacterized protein n=1 Tax=Caerostris darwini TaxID=1538125 RepID=A0AAV4TWG8_9ARAC|nr:hypothetical protein CDAR_203551 [Caerostris darwini]
MGVEWAPVPVMTTFSEKFATWSERTAAFLLFQIWRRGEKKSGPRSQCTYVISDCRTKTWIRAISALPSIITIDQQGITSKTKGQAAKNSPGARKCSSHQGLCSVKCLMGGEWAPLPGMTSFFSEKFATWSERTVALLLFQIWR